MTNNFYTSLPAHSSPRPNSLSKFSLDTKNLEECFQTLQFLPLKPLFCRRLVWSGWTLKPLKHLLLHMSEEENLDALNKTSKSASWCQFNDSVWTKALIQLEMRNCFSIQKYRNGSLHRSEVKHVSSEFSQVKCHYCLSSTASFLFFLLSVTVVADVVIQCVIKINM